MTSVPYGVHIDEAGMGYDAWCMANYGVDRFQMSYPVYLTNFGGGQSSLYAFLCMLLIKIFGNGHVNLLLMRLPGIIISLLAYWAGVYAIREAYGKKWALVGAFLLAVLPYFTMQCRFGLDCNLLVNMLTISIVFLWNALSKEKKPLFLGAGILWGLTYYTYSISYLSNTGILFCIFLYRLVISKNKKKTIVNWSFLFLPVLILALPLVLMLFVNQFDLNQFQLGMLTITKLPEYRAGEISFSNVTNNLSQIFQVIFFKDWLPYNAFDRYYTMYPISIPFIIIGLAVSLTEAIRMIKKRENSLIAIWILVFICYLCMGLLIGGDGINVNKMNGIFFSQFFLLISGLRHFIKVMAKKSFYCARGVFGLLMISYLVAFCSFSRYYFEEYGSPAHTQILFADTYDEVIKELGNRNMDCKTIYIDQDLIYYFWGQEIPPFDTPYKITGPNVYEYQSIATWYYFGDKAFEDVYTGKAIFICQAENAIVRDMLMERGITEQFTCGMYVCYYM